MGNAAWNRALRIAVLVALGAAVGWWLVHPRPSDEELIAELVTRAEHGVETKSVDEIMSCVSDDYEGQGDWSREDIWRVAMQWARSSEQAEVTVQDWQVDVEDGRAVGHFQVDVTLLEEGRGRPTTLFLTVDFKRERHGLRKVWLVRSVQGFDPDMYIEEFL
jgi:hypothetical protein